MKKINFKSFTAGFIASAILCGGAVFAGSQFTLSQFDAKLVFNGTEKAGSNKPGMYNNGSSYVPTALIYNGTTYVPLRFFADSSGLPVKYDSKAKTIFVGKVPEDERIQRTMSDLIKPYSVSHNVWIGSGVEVDKSMKLGGKEYNKGYKFTIQGSGDYKTTGHFNLEGKYINISGIAGIQDNWSGEYTTKVSFFGDDKLLGSVDVKNGELPKNFSIDVTGVLKLDITCQMPSFSGEYQVNLADVMIKQVVK